MLKRKTMVKTEDLALILDLIDERDRIDDEILKLKREKKCLSYEQIGLKFEYPAQVILCAARRHRLEKMMAR